MTGFGRYYHKDDDREVLVEVRSLNHRTLKVHVNLSEMFSRFEDAVLRQVRERLRRGSVEVRIRVRTEPGEADVRLNEPLLRGLVAAWRKAADGMGIEPRLGAESLLGLPGALELPENLAGAPDEEWAPVARGLSLALDDLVRMRAEEGGALGADLRERSAEIRTRIGRIQALGPDVLDRYQEKLRRNVSRLMGAGDDSISLEDLKREIAVFADRADINEECLRTLGHLDEVDRLLDRGGEAGRKMEFLAQELLREVNTLSAKANDYGISKLAVEAKTEVEKIKEIAQNIE
jgi:uncharacterized protein (TIGR00255 family)